MPAPFTIECTSCGAKLKLTDRSKLGKKIKCPKCAEVFVAATEDDLEDDDIEELDDEEELLDDDEEESRPLRKKGAVAAGGKKGAAAKGGKGKKGKAKNSGSNLPLILGGIAGVVLLFGGLVGVLFATGAFGAAKIDPNQIQVNSTPGSGVFSSLLKEQGPIPIPPRSPIPEVAKWLPADTELVVHLRVADIMESPLVKDLLKSLQLEGKGDEFLAAAGLKLTDVESVTLGISGLEGVAKQAQDAQMSLMMGGPPQASPMAAPGLGVIKLKKPVTYDALVKLAQGIPLLRTQHAGKEYLEATEPRTSTKSGVYLASESLLVAGDSTHLRKVLEQGAVAAPVPNFGFMDWTDHFVFAMAPNDLKSLQAKAPPATGNPLADQAVAAFKDGVSGFSFSLTVKGGLESELALGCLDPSRTTTIVKTLNDGWALAKTQYPDAKKQLPPWAVPLVDQLVNNLAVAGADRVALVTTNIPDSAQQQLAQLPSMIMTQMMMSAMLGGGGPGAMPPEKPTGPSDSPSPGNTPGTPPELTEPTNAKATKALKLPKGFELTGSLSDGFHSVRESERALRFHLETTYQGEGSDCQVVAVGKLETGECITGGGEAITLQLPTRFGPDAEEDPWELMTNMDGFVFLSNSPGHFDLAIPLGETKPIKSLAGTFRYITGKRSKLVQIKNFRDQVGKTPADPALKAAGLELKLTKEKETFGETEILTVSVKPGFLLSKLQTIDEQGEISYEAFSGVAPDKRVQTIKPHVGELELKPGLGIQLFVYSDLEEVEVPFTFENIELPKKGKQE